MDDKGKKSRLSAPQYVDYVMTFVQKNLNDESIFPTKHGKGCRITVLQLVVIFRHQDKIGSNENLCPLFAHHYYMYILIY